MLLTTPTPSRVSLALLLAFAAVAAPAALAADTYPIKLVRPPTVGQKYTLTAEGALTRHTKISSGEKEISVNDDEFAIHLEGTIEVLAVNKDGEEGKAACTISKCTRISAEGESELVPAGRVITATGGKEDTSYTIDQGSLSDQAKEAIDLVLRMGEEDGYNDDKIYGTTTPQPVGGTWEMDAKASSQEAKDDAVLFDPKDASGSMKIDTIETVDGVECLRISGITEIKRLEVKSPDGLKFDKGSLTAHYGGAYPADPKQPGPLRESMSLNQTATYTGKGKAESGTLVETKVQKAADLSRKYLPAEKHDEKKPETKEEKKSD